MGFQVFPATALFETRPKRLVDFVPRAFQTPQNRLKQLVRCDCSYLLFIFVAVFLCIFMGPNEHASVLRRILEPPGGTKDQFGRRVGVSEIMLKQLSKTSPDYGNEPKLLLETHIGVGMGIGILVG